MLGLDMNRKYILLLIVLVVMDVIDGDFKDPSALDVIKWILYVICFVLTIRDGLKNEDE